MVLYGLTHGAEYDTLLGQCLLECGLDRYGVHDSINCHAAAQRQTLLKGYTQFVKGLHNLRINLLKTLGTLFLDRGVGVI